MVSFDSALFRPTIRYKKEKPFFPTINSQKFLTHNSFRFWFRFCRVIWILVAKKQTNPTPLQQKMKNVALFCIIIIHIYFYDTVHLKACAKEMAVDSAQKEWLRAVSYCAESDCAHYDTVLRAWDWLRAVWYWAEISPQILIIDLAQYNTSRRLTLRSMILHGDWIPAVWYCAEIRKNSNNLAKYFTYWSLAPAGSNDEKKLEVENIVGLFL